MKEPGTKEQHPTPCGAKGAEPHLPERAREEAHQHYALMFEKAPTGKSIFHIDGTVVQANQAFAELLGRSIEEIEGADFGAFTHPQDLQQSRELLQEMLSGAIDSCDLELRYLTREDAVVWAQVHISLHRDAQGEPICFLSYIADITEAKKAAESQARFESILDVTDDLISFVDTDFIYRAVNSSYLTYWNIQKQDIVDHHVSEVLGAEAFEHIVRPRLESCWRDGEIRYQDWFDYPGRGRRFMDVCYNPVQGKDGATLGAAVTIRDITLLKEKEQELTKTLGQLRRSNAELEQFAYMASHDLQEPLNTIISYIQLLRDDYSSQLDPLGNQYLQGTRDGAARMKALIQALLKYSRLRNFELDYESFTFRQVVDDVLLGLDSLLQSSQAVVHVEADAPLRGDRAMLRQLLQNLIANGIKFQRPHTIPELHLSVEEKPGRQLLSVRDNGIGVEPNHFDEIFDIFRRLHSRARYDGTGVGLAICKQIVELHQGEIWLESSPGEGSTFYVALPHPEPDPMQSQSQSQSSQTEFSSP